MALPVEDEAHDEVEPSHRNGSAADNPLQPQATQTILLASFDLSGWINPTVPGPVPPELSEVNLGLCIVQVHNYQ